MSPDWRPVAASRDVPPGRHLVVEVAGIPVALVREGDGRLHAMMNVCPHRGGPVGEGAVRDGVITCPWHGWSFLLANGQHERNPGVRLRTFEVREEAGRVLVAAPGA